MGSWVCNTSSVGETMTGTEFVALLRGKTGQAREQAILDAVRSESYLPVRWMPIQTSAGGHSAVLYVASDALRIGTPSDSVRVTVTHQGAQNLADMFGCALPTTKISRLVHEQAQVHLEPMPQAAWVNDGTMASADPDGRAQCHGRQQAGRPQWPRGLGRQGLGTDEPSDDATTQGANFGWFRGDGKPWQTLGLMHDTHHHDYSQSLRLVSRRVDLDNIQTADLLDVLTNPTLSPLVSDEGVLQLRHHPTIPTIPQELGPKGWWRELACRRRVDHRARVRRCGMDARQKRVRLASQAFGRPSHDFGALGHYRVA